MLHVGKLYGYEFLSFSHAPQGLYLLIERKNMNKRLGKMGKICKHFQLPSLPFVSPGILVNPGTF